VEEAERLRQEEEMHKAVEEAEHLRKEEEAQRHREDEIREVEAEAAC
jgi:hypothetical protein